MEFVCNNKFMVRTPSLPLHYLEDYHNQDKDIYEFIRSNKKLDDFFQKALLVSSKSLYESYINKPMDAKKYNKLKQSLLKYFVRSITRATPYGYLASVSLAEFGPKTNLKRGECHLDIKVDLGWLSKLIYNLENNNDIKKKLRYQFNKACFISGNRMKNLYFTNHGVKKQTDTVIKQNSIRFTSVVELVRHRAEKFVEYEELVNSIREQYTDVPEELIANTIDALIENEYLLSELRIPAYCSDGLCYIIDKLKEIECENVIVHKLYLVKMLIQQYKENEDITTLNQIISTMEEITENTNYLLVNVGNNMAGKELNDCIKQDLSALAKILYSVPVKINSLSKFKEKFLEVYGSNVEVPLLEIIDENRFDGLAAIGKQYLENTETEKRINKKIEDKIFRAIKMNQKEVSFLEEDFANIVEEREEYNADFDLNIMITHDGEEFHFYTGAAPGSMRAGAMIQRFSGCFSEDEMKDYDQLYQQNQIDEQEYLLVEVKEAPVYGRLGNVVNNRKNYTYYLCLGNCYGDNEHEIELSDIVVGMSQMDEIYLKSRRIGKKILMVSNNMLNPQLSSPIVRLLKQISDSQRLFPSVRLSWLLEEVNYKYIPRIRIGNIVVSPQCWIADSEELSASTFEEFKQKLAIYKEEYQVDDRVYLAEVDHRIIVDLTREDYLEILYAEYQKKKRLNFQEVEKGVVENAIIDNEAGEKYLNECVFSISLKGDTNKGNDKQEDIDCTLQNTKRGFLLGEDGWVYFKLYGVKNREDEILSKEIPILLERTNCIEHFFLRYADEEGPHLRIRLKFANSEQAYKHLQEIVCWGKEAREKGLVNKILFDVYQRENNRYGGEEIIETCEKIFFDNSRVVEKLLSFYDMEQKEDREKCYVYGITHLLKGLTKNIKDMFEVMDSRAYDQESKEVYKKKKKYYMQMLEEVLDKDIVQEFENLETEWENEYSSSSLFREELEKQINRHKNTNYRENIIFSIIHMYCNRLTGKREYENKYLGIVRNALYHVWQKRKHFQNE